MARFDRARDGTHKGDTLNGAFRSANLDQSFIADLRLYFGIRRTPVYSADLDAWIQLLVPQHGHGIPLPTGSTQHTFNPNDLPTLRITTVARCVVHQCCGRGYSASGSSRARVLSREGSRKHAAGRIVGGS